MVESAFNPMAYSRAHASGLWQFIPSTGRNFNLEQNWWYDGRRDIMASTDAALDYLQSLYEQFGDWHLALAAYNMGENGLARAIERNRARGKRTDYQSVAIPEGDPATTCRRCRRSRTSSRTPQRSASRWNRFRTRPTSSP